MRRRIALGPAALALILSSGATAGAELRRIGTIEIPGEALTSFDIGVVDQASGRYYLADRSNKAVDIIDVETDRYLGRVGAFVGAVMKDGKVDNEVSGPNGVVSTGREIWAGDGDSTIRIIDPATGGSTATIASGGTKRLDEMAFDPKDEVFIGVNNADFPPFATLISTRRDRAVIGKVVFPTATGGAEQPAYNPEDGMFYMAIPEFDGDRAKGGVPVVDPRSGGLVRVLPVANCRPAGLAFGPDGDFVLGCNADGRTMPAITTIMNARTGVVVANVAGLGGADMVNYNARNNQYYTASRGNPGGPALGVIDAATHRLVQTVPITGGAPHSVASSEANGHVYVPVGAVGGGDGTIHVYAPVP